MKQAFKVFGFATDVGPPADFVNKTRPGGDPDYIPVFQPPPEPARPALKDNELKAVKGDLDGVQKQHDALRQAFRRPPRRWPSSKRRKKSRNRRLPAPSNSDIPFAAFRLPMLHGPVSAH